MLVSTAYRIQQILHWKSLWKSAFPFFLHYIIYPAVTCISCLTAAQPSWCKALSQGWLRDWSKFPRRTGNVIKVAAPTSRTWILSIIWGTVWLQHERTHRIFVYRPPSMKDECSPCFFQVQICCWLPGDHCFLFLCSVCKIKLPVVLYPSSVLQDFPLLLFPPDCALLHFKFCKSSSFSSYYIFCCWFEAY